jgi:gliding motility-associated-like protein
VPIELIINPLPQVDLSAYDGQVICTDAASGEVIDNDFSPPIIDTGLSEAEFDLSWQRNGEAISADTSALTVDQPGDYQVVATNIETGCQFSSQASIEESSVPDFEIQVISPPFSRDPIVEVRNINGSGSFEFRLDDGNWVSLGDSESLRFSGFPFGQHQISGRDILGCGVRIKDFQVIGYRSFFTPNQDGHNDRWNIPSLKNQRDALVLIYDRYGKLLYKFRPGELGWDGTYNGKTLPSNDYWFSVEYTDPRTGKQSIFRGNITLKR